MIFATVWFLSQPLLLTGHHGEISAMVFGRGSRPLLLCSASADYIIVWDIQQCQRKTQKGEKTVNDQTCFGCCMCWFAFNSPLGSQAKSRPEQWLGRCWVKSSTCRSAPLMSEWPPALDPLYTFSAQRQETTQISITFPTHRRVSVVHVHSLDDEKITCCAHPAYLPYLIFWRYIICSPY